MGKIFQAILILVTGAALGFFLAPKAPNFEQTRQKLAALSDKELDEYRALQGLREKYEKADELLGKVMLVLIADLGLKVSEKNAAVLRESARGVHVPPASEPRSALPPPQTPSVPRQSDRASSPESAPVPVSSTSAPLSGVARPAGHVPFNDQFELRRKRNGNCDKNPPGWYILSNAPEDYRIGTDSALGVGDDSVAFIESLTTSPRRHAELSHCANVVELAELVGKRVRFTALIRAEGVRGYAYINLRAESQYRERVGNPRVKFGGSFDWKPYIVEMDVTAEMASLSYGITLESSGKAWIRNAAFQVVESAR